MKILTDTLMVNGKYSLKRLQVFSSFWVVVVYIFMPAFMPKFPVNEFAVASLLALGGFTAYRIQKKNENEITNESE